MARYDSSKLLETARRAAAAAETAAQVASASPPNIHKQMRAADALQEFVWRSLRWRSSMIAYWMQRML